MKCMNLHHSLPIRRKWQYLTQTLKPKRCHIDKLFITGCTWDCHSDNLRCSQWWEGRQYDDILVSAEEMIAYDMEEMTIISCFLRWHGESISWKGCLRNTLSNPIRGEEHAGYRHANERSLVWWFFTCQPVQSYSEPGNGEYSKVLGQKWVVWVPRCQKLPDA